MVLVSPQVLQVFKTIHQFQRTTQMVQIQTVNQLLPAIPLIRTKFLKMEVNQNTILSVLIFVTMKSLKLKQKVNLLQIVQLIMARILVLKTMTRTFNLLTVEFRQPLMMNYLMLMCPPLTILPPKIHSQILFCPHHPHYRTVKVTPPLLHQARN